MAEPHWAESLEVVVARHKNEGRSAKQDAVSVVNQERRDKALALRRSGATYAQIAKELDCSRSTANELFHQALAAIPKENAEAVLKLELERLDRDLRRCEAAQDMLEAKVRGGDVKAAKAMASMMVSSCRIQERRAKYLGLDAPTKQEITGKDGGPIITHDDILARIARVIDAAAASGGDQGPQQ